MKVVVTSDVCECSSFYNDCPVDLIWYYTVHGITVNVSVFLCPQCLRQDVRTSGRQVPRLTLNLRNLTRVRALARGVAGRARNWFYGALNVNKPLKSLFFIKVFVVVTFWALCFTWMLTTDFYKNISKFYAFKERIEPIYKIQSTEPLAERNKWFLKCFLKHVLNPAVVIKLYNLNVYTILYELFKM